MAKNKTYDFLEKIQEQVYKSLPNHDKLLALPSSIINENILDGFLTRLVKANGESVSEQDYETLRKKFGQLINAQREHAPTKYEDPLRYEVLLRLNEQIKNAAKELSIELPQTINFGTLPTGRVNAMALQAQPTDEYLVLFESELFMFSLYFSKAIIIPLLQLDRNTAVVNYDDLKNNINGNQESISRFLDVLTAYLFEGRPSRAKSYVPNPLTQKISYALLESMELFIVGHEYGHIIKGHLTKNALRMTELGGQKVNEFTRSWEQEFEADAIGLQLMLNAVREGENNLSLSFCGATLFFSCIEVIYRSIAIFRGIDYSTWVMGNATHPPPEMRRDFIQQTFINSLKDGKSKESIDLAHFFDLTTKALMELATPLLISMKEDGKKLHPIWQNA